MANAKPSCPTCGGVGKIQPGPPASGYGRGPFDLWPPCWECGGSGKAKAPPPEVTRCPACGGAGVVDICPEAVIPQRLWPFCATCGGNGWLDEPRVDEMLADKYRRLSTTDSNHPAFSPVTLPSPSPDNSKSGLQITDSEMEQMRAEMFPNDEPVRGSILYEALGALESVERWWLNEQMGLQFGAPACIFKVREVLAKARGDK